MEIVQKFTDSDAAVTATLKLVIKFLLSNHKKQIAKAHTEAELTNDTMLAIFDIDDTIIFDVQRKGKKKQAVVPNKPLLRLMRRLHSLGLEVHVITARLNEPEIVKMTEREMKEVDAVWHTLSLAPDHARTSMEAVSAWKKNTRQHLAKTRGSVVLLTVGDQWGDLLKLKNDNEIDVYDHKYGSDSYMILRPHDGVSIWGLKLPVD